MGHKEVERTCNINNTFGSGAANKGTLQQRFKKFCQEDERLEDEESSGHPSKVNKDQLRAAIIKADHLTNTQEVAKKKKPSTSTFLQSFSIWSKLERWKISVSGCLMSWPQTKKIIILKCHLLFEATTMNHFRSNSDVWWKVHFIQPVMTSSAVEPRRSSRALPKAKLAPKKRSGSLFGGLLWSDPLQFSESWQIHYIWKVCSANRCPKNCTTCSQHWSTERAQFISTAIPNHTSHNQCVKSWTD